jgi:hypothetical protein
MSKKSTFMFVAAPLALHMAVVAAVFTGFNDRNGTLFERQR